MNFLRGGKEKVLLGLIGSDGTVSRCISTRKGTSGVIETLVVIGVDVVHTGDEPLQCSLASSSDCDPN